MLWIGLMSGTSADATDAALVELGDDVRDLELVAFVSLPLSPNLQQKIHGLSQGKLELRELARLDIEIGEHFAEAALAVTREAALGPSEIAGIGSHGQTVGHFPEPGIRSSLQIGSPSIIHARTGIPVLSDFRSADMAVGGQGAPLTPFFHHAYFSRDDECRAVLNIGGFCNLSYLPTSDAARLIAFDAGPGNALIDRAVRHSTQGAERYDRDGRRAARGRAFDDLVSELLLEGYFAKSPPKSTGHEQFGPEYLERVRAVVLARGGGDDDLVATLTQLTAMSVADQARRFLPTAPELWLVCGGGVSNPTLMAALERELAPARVEPTDRHGIPADALEAITFAVLGWCSSRGIPTNLPSATGATRPVVLGSATPPRAER